MLWHNKWNLANMVQNACVFYLQHRPSSINLGPIRINSSRMALGNITNPANMKFHFSDLDQGNQKKLGWNKTIPTIQQEISIDFCGSVNWQHSEFHAVSSMKFMTPFAWSTFTSFESTCWDDPSRLEPLKSCWSSGPLKVNKHCTIDTLDFQANRFDSPFNLFMTIISSPGRCYEAKKIQNPCGIESNLDVKCWKWTMGHFNWDYIQ